MPLPYLEQDCKQTLREALEDYFAGIPGLITEANAPKKTAELFRHHDVGHVVFGCDTTVNGEPLADTWQILGTDVKLSEYMEYAKLPEARAIFKQTGILMMIWLTLRALPRLLVIMWRVFRMPKKWPFWKNDQYLDVPLCDIRKEFRIKVIKH
jgi:hypothetical protein